MRNNYLAVALVVITTFVTPSCKERSDVEQPQARKAPLVQTNLKESKVRDLYKFYDERFKVEKPYTYMMNKYLDLALEYVGAWDDSFSKIGIEEKKDLLTKYSEKSSKRFEDAKLGSTPEDKFFNDLYFEMIAELNTFDAVEKRVLEGVKMSRGTMEKIDPADMMVSVGGFCYSKLDILYRTENKLLLEHEKVNIKDGDIVSEENISGPRKLNRYMGFSIWLKKEIRYRNYDNRCPNINYARSAMREWENAMNNVRKFVEIPDNGWNRFTWGTGTDYHVALSDKDNPEVPGISSVGAVPWAFVHMSIIAKKGNYMHELGHTLGLLHEHQRPDRDDYIIVYTKNIDTGQLAQFMKVGKAYGPFDFESIMMYGSEAFAKTGTYSMKKKNGTTWKAQRSYLSTQDKINIKLIYN